MRTKRLVSGLLALMLVVGMVPMAVFAAPPGGGIGPVTNENSWTTAPTAKTDLVANGSAQELINGGTPQNGTAKYYVGAYDGTSYWKQWGSAIPTGTAAGTYTVWYAIDGGSNYTDLEPASLSVTIATAHTHTDANNQTVTFQPWTATDSLPTSGNYYLTANVTVSGTTTVSGTLNLCLNGHGILMTGNGHVFNISGGSTMNLFDCNGSDSTHYVTLNNWRGTAVSDSGTESAVTDGSGVVKVTGGLITGGNVTYSPGGGAFRVDGTFTMYGGTLLGNYAQYDTTKGSGGAIWSGGSTTIAGNSRITYNKAVEGDRGGVYITGSGTLNISGTPDLSGNSGRDIVMNGSTKKINFTDFDPDVRLGVIYYTGNPSDIEITTNANFADTAEVQAVMQHSNSGRSIVWYNGQAKIVSTYTVTWKDYDDTVLETDADVPAGATPTYDGTLPSYYVDDRDRLHVFTGWSPSVGAISGNTVYTAQYEQKSMYVFVQDHTVSPARTFYVADIEPSDDVSDLRARIAAEAGIPASQVTLIFAGRTLQDGKVLIDYNLQKGSTIHLFTGLFAAHSLTLNGNVGVNFYIDVTGGGATVSEIASGAKTLSVSFAWAQGSDAKTDVSASNVTVTSENYLDYLYEDVYFKIPCYVAAAEMSCGIEVSATVGSYTDSETYSVRDYADVILDSTSPFSAAFAAQNGAEKYAKLVDLVKNMLDYGAKSQVVFGVNTGDLANAGVSIANEEVSPATVLAAIESDISTLNGGEVAEYGLEFRYSTVLFLSNTTLRLYYTVVDSDLYNSVKAALGANERKLAATGMVYFEVANISPERLDFGQAFVIGSHTFYYSVLNYAALVLSSSQATAAEKDLAAATYRYNRAAAAYAG